MLALPTLDHADAMRAVSAIQDALAAKGKGAVIAVVDSHGELLAFLRVGETSLPGINIAMNKAYTAARTGGTTAGIGKAVRDVEDGFDINYFGDARFMGWEGGLPVRVEGRLVGGIGVSGLTGAEDAALAQTGIDAILAGLRK